MGPKTLFSLLRPLYNHQSESGSSMSYVPSTVPFEWKPKAASDVQTVESIGEYVGIFFWGGGSKVSKPLPLEYLEAPY